MRQSITHWQRILLQEKDLSPKQKKIAKLDPPTDELDAGDFEALRANKKNKKMKTLSEFLEEMGSGDWGYQKIQSVYEEDPEMAKKIAYLVTKNPQASWEDVDMILSDEYGKEEMDELLQTLGLYDLEEDMSNDGGEKVSQASEGVKKVCREAASILGINDIDNAIITNQTGDYDFTVDHESGYFEVQDVSYTRQHEGEVRIIVQNSADIYIPIEDDLAEGQDHEVSMAHASLKAIVSAASQLMNKIGTEEIDLPGWIQDHITNAENYINQANKGYHELNDDESEDSLTSIMERMRKNGYK